MSKLTGVCGTKNSGKTLVIQGLLRLSFRQGLRVGAFKPIDVGETVYLAKDVLSDGEQFQKTGNIPEHINLINPYMLHEQLPPKLAAKRVGVKIEKTLLNTRLQQLKKIYPHIWIEGPSTLRIPVCGKDNWMTLLRRWSHEVIWISGIGEEALEHTLFSCEMLQNSGITPKILLNNQTNERNTELVHYQWLTLEEELSAHVQGLIPYIKDENKLERVTEALDEIIDETWLDQEEK